MLSQWCQSPSATPVLIVAAVLIVSSSCRSTKYSLRMILARFLFWITGVATGQPDHGARYEQFRAKAFDQLERILLDRSLRSRRGQRQHRRRSTETDALWWLRS